ncbi:uncharacterized protein FYW61_020601 [Anableps anableps]
MRHQQKPQPSLPHRRSGPTPPPLHLLLLEQHRAVAGALKSTVCLQQLTSSAPQLWGRDFLRGVESVCAAVSSSVAIGQLGQEVTRRFLRPGAQRLPSSEKEAAHQPGKGQRSSPDHLKSITVQRGPVAGGSEVMQCCLQTDTRCSCAGRWRQASVRASWWLRGRRPRSGASLLL